MLSMLAAVYLLGAAIFYIRLVAGSRHMPEDGEGAEIIELFPAESAAEKAA